jgi:D-tyrosyl-tRNA(Tyr) deacylase
MIGLLQRVSSASVSLVAVHRDDEARDIARLGERILSYRVFPDAEDRMNLSIQDISGGLLLVPQFTLTADTRKGTRASFTKGAAPEIAGDYFDRLVATCSESLKTVASGRFGADMQVSLTNDGPVTFWLES